MIEWSVSPGLSEACDGVDNNCNGLIDDEDSNVVDGSAFYADMDGDGFGNADFVTQACTSLNVMLTMRTIVMTRFCHQSNGSRNL